MTQLSASREHGIPLHRQPEDTFLTTQPKRLEHLGTPNTGKDGSPSFYATDDDRYIVQGYKLTSPEARAQLVNFPEGEDAVIITRELADLIVAHHAGTTR